MEQTEEIETRHTVSQRQVHLADDTLLIVVITPLATMSVTIVASIGDIVGRHACVSIVNCCNARVI